VNHFKVCQNDFSEHPHAHAHEWFHICEAIFDTNEEVVDHFNSFHVDFISPSPGNLPTEKRIINVYRERICPPCSLSIQTRLKLQEHIHAVHLEFYNEAQVGGEPPLVDIEVLPVLRSLNMATKYMADFDYFNCDDVDERVLQRSSAPVDSNSSK